MFCKFPRMAIQQLLVNLQLGFPPAAGISHDVTCDHCLLSFFCAIQKSLLSNQSWCNRRWQLNFLSASSTPTWKNEALCISSVVIQPPGLPLCLLQPSHPSHILGCLKWDSMFQVWSHQHWVEGLIASLDPVFFCRITFSQSKSKFQDSGFGFVELYTFDNSYPVPLAYWGSSERKPCLSLNLAVAQVWCHLQTCWAFPAPCSGFWWRC